MCASAPARDAEAFAHAWEGRLDAPSDGPAVTELLEDLAGTLDDLPSGNPADDVAVVQQKLDVILAALTRWISALGAGNETSGEMDLYVARSVLATLRAGIGGPLASAPTGLAPDWAQMSALCKDERTAITLLHQQPTLRQHPNPGEPPPDAWAITVRRCIIENGKIRSEYTRPDRPGEDAPQGIKVYGLSTALAFLRISGIKYVQFFNADNFTIQQRGWLINSARKLFTDCGSRLNLVVNTTVCASGVTMYTHISFLPSQTCQIRFEAFPVIPASFASTVAEAKASLMQRFGLKAILEEGGAAWTVAELGQLASALAKMPAADLVVLPGCTFVRKTAAPTDTEETQEAGSYRFADRTITLLDASFCGDDYGFVGCAGAIGPYSHWTILHEIGHAVEKYSWEPDYRRWDTTAITDQISRLRAEQNALSHTPDTAARIQQIEQQITVLLKQRGEYLQRQADLVTTLRQNRSTSASLVAFVNLVTQKNLVPCTGYAFQNWTTKHGEFFAEAYSLFLNEPQFLKFILKDVYDWFAAGAYRASWR